MKLLMVLLFLTHLCTAASVCSSAEAFFADIASLRPSQVWYSQKDTEDKIIKAHAENGVVYIEEDIKHVPQHNNNTSIYPLKAAIPVIKTSFGFVLVDGHHDVMASRFVEATTIPVKIICDKSEALDDDAFWSWAADHKYAHLSDLSEKMMKAPLTFAELEDVSVQSVMSK